jgi:hypothetical protein
MACTRASRTFGTLRGLEVDDQIKLRRLLDGQVARLRALEDLVHVGSGAPKQISNVRSIGHKAPGIDRDPLGIADEDACGGAGDDDVLQCRRSYSMLFGPQHGAEAVHDAQLDAGMHDCMLVVRGTGARTMTQRLVGLILGAGTGLLLGGQLVIAADRIDLFDTNSNRTGYIIIDPKTKRFDTYDTKSKRTGWGTITRESGAVQVYDKDGNRIGSGVLPASGVKR